MTRARFFLALAVAAVLIGYGAFAVLVLAEFLAATG